MALSIKHIRYSVTTKDTINKKPTINQIGVICKACNNNGNCIVCNNMYTNPKYMFANKKSEELIKNTLCGSTLNSECITCRRVDECCGHVYSINLGNEAFYKMSYIKHIKSLLDRICISCESIIVNLSESDREVLNTYHVDKKITPALLELKEKVRKQDKMCNNCNNPIVKFKYKNAKSYFAISGKMSCTLCNNNIKGCEVCNLKKYNMAPTANELLSVIEKVVARNEHYIIVDYKTDPREFFYIGCYPCPQKSIRVEQFTFDSITNQAPTTTAIVQMMKNHERIEKIPETEKKQLFSRRLEIQKLIDNSEFAREDQNTTDSNTLACHYSMGVVSKNATIRQNINGGRPNSTSKMVLGLTGNINIEHCHLPVEYTNIMTTYIVVNQFTIDLIEDLILEGEVFGYFSITTRKYQSTYKAHKTLSYGDLVEIRFITGPESFILIGRYPSLHQYSVIVNAVIPSNELTENNQTIRFSLCHFPNMNADQDGDDAYSVKMSTTYANFEIMLVMRSAVNIISPSDGSQSKGVAHDEIVNLSAILGMKKITTYEAFRLLGIHWKRILDRHGLKSLYTGYDIISCLYPSNMHKDNVYSYGKFLKHGLQLSDVSTGPATINSIGRPINELYGRYAMYTFNSALIHIARESLDMYPFSIGLADYASSFEFMESNINEMKILADTVQTNINNYKSDVTKKLIPALSDDELAKMFIKEFDKISKFIKDRISNHFQIMKSEYESGTPNRNLWLMYNSGFKMSDETFQTICGQIKSDESVSRTSFWQRLRPTVEPESLDVYANGLVRYPLLHGYNMNDKLILLTVARKQINNIITATSKKGESARKITKCLEDMVVSELGWIAYEDTILNTHTNSYHLLNDYLVMVTINPKFISSLIDSKYNNRLKMLYIQTCRYMISEDLSSINLNMASPLDFDLIMSSSPNNYEPQRLVVNLPKTEEPYTGDELLDLIRNIVKYIFTSYMLEMAYTSSLEFLLMYFLCPQKNVVTYNNLSYLLDLLDNRYKRGNTPGTPIGMRASLGISQKETQASLSSFHEFSKTGTSIKDIAQNDNSRFTHLKSENVKGLLTIYCKDRFKLVDIKRGLEWCTLRHVYENILPKKNGYDVIISLEKLYKYSLTMTDIFEMTSNYIKYYELTCEPIIIISPQMFKEVRPRLIMSITIEFVDPLSRCDFELSMLDGISKGILSRYNVEVDECEIYNSQLIKESTYRLIMFLPDILKLSMYDTSDMIIVLPVEEVPKYMGMVHTLNSLSYSYVTEGIDRINYVILSMFQCRQITPRTILKFKIGECSTAKSVTYGTGFNDYPYAAIHNKVDKCDADISSCILNSLKVRVGTGFYQTSYKLDMLPSDSESVLQEYAD
jgi:hypothetical protein